MSTIEERVKKIVVEQLGVKEDEVTPNSSFVDDLGADSLDTVERVMALEEDCFAVMFPAATEAGRLWSSLSESFGLTPAEVRLARKLRDGRSLQDAADELSVSVNTVRNQLRAIFDKMGLKRQSDLIRALTELSALAGLIEADDPVRAQEEAIAQAPPLRFVSLADGRRLAYREYGDPAGRAVLTFHEGLGSRLLPPETEALARRLGLRSPWRPASACHTRNGTSARSWRWRSSRAPRCRVKSC